MPPQSETRVNGMGEQGDGLIVPGEPTLTLLQAPHSDWTQGATENVVSESREAVRRTFSRRTSYEEVVHQEDMNQQAGGVRKMVLGVLEWMVVLQRVKEERLGDQFFSPPADMCKCMKALRINQDLKELSRTLGDLIHVETRLGIVEVESLKKVEDSLADIATLLRAEISIQIPSRVGGCAADLSNRVRYMAGDGDAKTVVNDAMEGVAKLVYDLLGVESCLQCNPQEQAMVTDIDSDIMDMVANMCTGHEQPSDDQEKPTNIGFHEKALLASVSISDLGRQTLERSRKRKQKSSRYGNESKKVVNPSKKARRLPVEGVRPFQKNKTGSDADKPEVVSLLESKRKLVKADGLYKFVLWRQALRGEKERSASPSGKDSYRKLGQKIGSSLS